MSDDYHEKIVGAVNFTDTKAYDDAVARLRKMGYSEEEIKKLLGEKNGK